MKHGTRVTGRWVVMLVLVVVAARHAAAQVSPDRVYFGVGRPIPMSVTNPRSTKSDKPQKLTLLLEATDKPEPLATAPVLEGKVDVAALFPVLWKDKPRQTLYLQLKVGDEPVGAPVVLLPMINPLRAKCETIPGEKRPKITFEALKDEDDVYSGLRAYVDQRVMFETDAGEIEVALRPDAAPNTAWNFLHLAKSGFYTDITFHRVVPMTKDGHPFVIQAGDPTGGGSGGCGSYFDLEPSTLKHDLGVVSMARASDPDTNGSQFFIALSREGTSRLDGSYTAFGVVTRGLDVVRAISRTPLVPGKDAPEKPPVITRARVIDAPPFVPGKPTVPEADKLAPTTGNPER